MQPRELALTILYDIEKNGAYLNISFQKHTEQHALSARDAAFVKELVYGVVKHQLTLDGTVAQYSSVKLKKIAPYVLCILRLGLYQLFYMDKVPESAAVNESVKLTGRYAPRSRGFVNAILRKSTREGLFLPEGDGEEALSVRFSHPLPLVRWLIRQFGTERAIELMDAGNQAPALCVRVNIMKTEPHSLADKLATEGINVTPGALSGLALLFDGGGVQQLSAYQEGLFTIQDQSAQLAAMALAPQPGETVFDVCAAPGGKTTHLAEMMENEGQILALDLYEKRLQSVTIAAKRLGLSMIKTQRADAAEFAFPCQADRILIDAPCSGLGVIRRRPDIKYKTDLTDFRELVEIQKKILRHCADYLKPGGTLVYSTCTINPEENEQQIHAFLQEYPDFYLEAPTHAAMLEPAARMLETGMGTIYPGDGGGDGFFIAKLKRRSHG